MRRISFSSESGVILPIVIILMIALIITGIAFLNAAVMENRLVGRELYKNQAFWLAEAGLERTVWDLKEDIENTEEWTGWDQDDVDRLEDNINGEDGSIELGEGFYVVKLDFIDGDELLVTSTGTVKDIPRTVQIRVKAGMASPWNNAIFARKSAVGGAVIEGNARIHGSVLILGEEGAADPVMDMGGTAGIRNNYDVGAPQGMRPDLAVKVPSIVKIVNGESVETLDAALRVKYGQVALQGEVTVGENIPNNSIKRTMDEVHVPGEFVIGSGGIEDHVFTDNPDPHSQDPLIDAVTFPSLLDPYETYTTFLEYLRNNSLEITIGSGLDEIIESKISSEFYFDNDEGPDEVYGKYEAGKGGIGWYFDPAEGLHGKIYLYVEGIVWIEAESLSIGKKDVPIEYTGTGVIVVAEEVTDGLGNPIAITRNIEVHGDLLAVGEALYGGGFPHHALGLVTGTLGIAYPGEANLNLTGAFFAENAVHSGFQNQVAGTFVSNFFDMGSQVPSIYQVPELATHVPHGMPGAPPNWTLITSEWKELPNY